MYKNTLYQSTMGKPMEKSQVSFTYKPQAENKVVNLYPKIKYQRVQGFGSALTESSAVNYDAMPAATRAKFMKLFFDRQEGLGLNLCRTHIHSCDFSEGCYTYVEEGDKQLNTFSIAHDEKCIIPFIKDSIAACTDGLMLFCSPWSPPAFMKSNNDMLHGGKLLPEYYEAWARYYVKYIQAYQAHGVEFFALTVQNEAMATQTWESCVYTAEETALFVRDYLYPQLKKAGLDTKVLIWDHNKEHVVDWVEGLHSVVGARETVAGVAFHWYSGEHFDALRMAHELDPDLMLLETEFCSMLCKTLEQEWKVAMRYAYEIIGNLNNYAHGLTEWNILLDQNGEPRHDADGGCGAMAHYNKDTDQLHLSQVYYAMGHFSKFIQRGAVRLGSSKYRQDLLVTALENPDGSIVVVLENQGAADTIELRLNDYAGKVELAESSITTLVIEAEP